MYFVARDTDSCSVSQKKIVTFRIKNTEILCCLKIGTKFSCFREKHVHIISLFSNSNWNDFIKKYLGKIQTFSDEYYTAYYNIVNAVISARPLALLMYSSY
jgi:hypothetical protein